MAGGISNSAQLTFANPNNQTFAGAISGGGSVTKTAAGTLVLTGPAATRAGRRSATAPCKSATPPRSDRPSGAATISSGVLDLEGFNVGVGALSGTGTIDNLSGSATYTLTAGNGDATSTFSGVIQNTSAPSP